MHAQVGMDNNPMQATASKQVEMFFKFLVILCPGDIGSLLRICLQILYSLKLVNKNSGNVTTFKIVTYTD